MRHDLRTSLAIALLLAAVAPLGFTAAEDADPGIILADGGLKLTPAKGWVRKTPRSTIVEHEFAAPKLEGDPEDGRLIAMGAGGEIVDNITRWKNQFTTADGKPVTDGVKVRELKVAGLPVHIVDIRGTFKDQPAGPNAGGKTVLKEDYRMLGAIIVGGKELGNYFVKFYGPKKTMEGQEKAFLESINSLKVTNAK